LVALLAWAPQARQPSQPQTFKIERLGTLPEPGAAWEARTKHFSGAILFGFFKDGSVPVVTVVDDVIMCTKINGRMSLFSFRKF